MAIFSGNAYPEIQDMLLEVVNFAPVTRNGQKQLPSLDCTRRPNNSGNNDHHSYLEGSLGYPRPPTLPQNSIGSLRGDDCTRRPNNSGNNDHHSYLEGSLGYPRPPTLPQNSIGSLRGDVRPDLCQSGLSSIPAGMSGNTWIVVEKNIPTRERNDSKRDGETSWNPIRAMRSLGYLQGEVTESLLDSYGLHEDSSSRSESVLGFLVICNLHYRRNIA
ncbi:hypothetical protein CRG98_012146 [Punica granatum]|uniref:Uncharacterized protein n=1 Tax=Punica granatum TaxID=22663 RepID=A0A2I0KGD8_PUNGR|nr:hypothetical protein CRG98_012146 [Punica granatum]